MTTSNFETNWHGTAIVLANDLFATPNGKTAHGLVRGGERFSVQAVVDPASAGTDAGVLVDGRHRGIPVVADVATAMARSPERPAYAIVGIATHGGRLTQGLRQSMLEALQADLHLVNGLHQAAAGDLQLADLAAQRGLFILDIRKPRPVDELRFWSGDVLALDVPRIAVLGMDCAIGKRTTTLLLKQALLTSGRRVAHIYTGQTGWLQGGRHGMILDATPNDYVSGELEHALLACAREEQPEMILIEGQSSLRNPSGPCGAELLLSCGARHVVLQHAPARACFEGLEHLGCRIPDPASECALIKHYGARVLGVVLNETGMTAEEVNAHAELLETQIDLPVVRATETGMERLASVLAEAVL